MDDVLALINAASDELKGITKSDHMYVSAEARGRLMCVQHLIETAHRHAEAFSDFVKQQQRQ